MAIHIIAILNIVYNCINKNKQGGVGNWLHVPNIDHISYYRPPK